MPKPASAATRLFWLDPWSAQGQEVSAKLLPLAQDLRLHAERAIVLLAEVRTTNPGLKEPDALTAMDLGARRLDLIGMKFELAQEIADAYAKAVASQHDKAQSRAIGNMLERDQQQQRPLPGSARCLFRLEEPSTARSGSVRTGPTGSTMSPSATTLRSKAGSAAADMFEEGIRDWRSRQGSARCLGPRLAGLGLSYRRLSGADAALPCRSNQRISPHEQDGYPGCNNFRRIAGTGDAH